MTHYRATQFTQPIGSEMRSISLRSADFEIALDRAVQWTKRRTDLPLNIERQRVNGMMQAMITPIGGDFVVHIS